MKSTVELCAAIRTLLADKLSLQELSDDTDLLQDGLLDSVSIVHLILNLEQRFGVRIELSELEIEDLRSVRSIAGLLIKLQPTAVHDDLELAHAAGNTLARKLTAT